MAQNTQSTTATRNTVPGTANDAPVAPQLFTEPSKREYIPDAKRVGDGAEVPELAKARERFAEGDYAGARAGVLRAARALARLGAGSGGGGGRRAGGAVRIRRRRMGDGVHPGGRVRGTCRFGGPRSRHSSLGPGAAGRRAGALRRHHPS